MTQNAEYAFVESLTPDAQLAWFQEHQGIRMSHTEWDRFYCDSLQHKGLCCESCHQDEAYEGYPNFDDYCCCIGYKAASEAAQIDSSGAS